MPNEPPNVSEDLKTVSGIGVEVEKSLKRRGITTKKDLRRADQQELAKCDRIGNALAARIKANVGETKLGDLFGSTRDIQTGDIVVDEQVENNLLGVVVTEPYGRADEVTADGKLVSEYEKNLRYDVDAPVVDVVLRHDWLKENLQKGDYTLFTYPVPRLEILEPDVQESKLIGEINKVKVIGNCVNCGDTMTTDQDRYIEGADGRFYCSIACHNEEVT